MTTKLKRSTPSSPQAAHKKSDEPKGKRKIHKVMEEFKEGELVSGSGKKVEDRKQAVAIALNEARKSGAKIPKRKGADVAKN